jgi:hypothetical protein
MVLRCPQAAEVAAGRFVTLREATQETQPAGKTPQFPGRALTSMYREQQWPAGSSRMKSAGPCCMAVIVSPPADATPAPTGYPSVAP